MGMDTVTAARILKGQLQGLPGEEHELAFERLPYTALSKVYNTNQQVPDSAGTATALLSGVKTLAGVIGVGPDVVRGDCGTVKGNELATLLDIAEQQGLATGLVSTTTSGDSSLSCSAGSTAASSSGSGSGSGTNRSSAAFGSSSTSLMPKCSKKRSVVR